MLMKQSFEVIISTARRHASEMEAQEVATTPQILKRGHEDAELWHSGVRDASCFHVYEAPTAAQTVDVSVATKLSKHICAEAGPVIRPPLLSPNSSGDTSV